MRGKGGMALVFAPFAGITRIRFKGSARFRASQPAGSPAFGLARSI